MASAVAPPTTPKATTSAPTSPLYQQAVAQAKAALAAAQQPIQNEQTQSDAAFKQRETDASGEAAALAELLKGIGPSISGIYSTAAQNQGLLADGFSQGEKDALQGNTDNLNAMLDKLGSPAHLDSHATEAGDVTYGLGGYIPGSTLNREGAAFGAAAAMLPGTALLKGQENVKSLRGQAILADKGFQDKLAEMAGNLPGAIQDNYAKLQALAMEDKKFALAVKSENFSEAMAIANNNLALAKYNTGIDEFNTKTTLDYQKLNLQSQKFARQVYMQDRDYQLSLARLGISQKSLQLRVAAQEYKLANGGFTPSQVAKFNATLQQGLDTLPPGTTYVDFVKKAVENGVPLSLAIQRANVHWPANQRPVDPDTLAKALSIPQQAAAAGAQYNQAQWNNKLGNYNQMVGLGPRPVYSTNPSRVDGVTVRGNLVGVHIDFANAVIAAARAAGATVVQITSGRRSAKQNAAVGGVPNSNHLTGNAIDGRALVKGKWVPLGQLPTLAHYGIRSGDQPGFFNGKPDPYHVDAGANAGSLRGASDLKSYAFQKSSSFGWSRADMRALDRLWTRESGWNPNAKNPSSGALGIPQALGHKLPPGYAVDPQAQIDWGLNYIKQRYGTPSAAWQHETRYGWY